MNFIKKNYGWIIVMTLAILPMLIIYNMMNNGGLINDYDNTLGMLYHVSGEFSIRWMTAVLTCTPFFILFGVNTLFVRQAMGIATAIWSLLHFLIFIWAEGFLETFTQVNYVAGFVAVIILIPLLFTSNRKSMKWLKTAWKKIQSFAYGAIFLSLLHVAILDKTWIIYAVIVGIGFILRIPSIRKKIFAIRNNRKANKA